MTASPLPATSATQRISDPSRLNEQLRRFLYVSLKVGETTPLLLPLSQDQQRKAAWIHLDQKCQLLLIQILRIAVVPWYSKLTNDRELYQEVTGVVRHGLHNLKEALLQKTATGLTRLEQFTLFEVAALLQLHYVEQRRALAMSTNIDQQGGAAANIYLSSNPHPALSIDLHRELQLDEAYLDVLLLAGLQSVLPASHFGSHNEVLIIMDIVKGLIRAQLRIHGSKPWVAVRALSNFIDTQQSRKNDPPSFATSSALKWYDRDSLLQGLHFIYAILKSAFFYLAVIYLDIFTPLAEPKRRSRRRKGPEADQPNGWNFHPLLEVIVEAFEWKQRILTTFLEVWIRVTLAWGGNRLLERQAKDYLFQWTEPGFLVDQVVRIQSILADVPNQSPPQAVVEPPADLQRQEFEALITKIVDKVQFYPPVALLLGHNKSIQRRSIERALSPFLSPPLLDSSVTISQVATVRTMLALLERLLLLINPALEV